MDSWIRNFICTILCFVALLYSIPMHAQMETQEALDVIKDHGLVIRLNCNSAKIDTINSILKRGDLKESTAKKLKSQRDKTVKEFDEKNKVIIQTFQSNYEFSKVYFVPDSLFREFVDGRRDMIFLDADFNTFSDESVPDHFVFGYFDYSMKLNTLTLRHSEYKNEIAAYKMVKGLFPDKIKASSGFWSAVKSVFTLGINWQKNLPNTVKKLQEQLDEID